MGLIAKLYLCGLFGLLCPEPQLPGLAPSDPAWWSCSVAGGEEVYAVGRARVRVGGSSPRPALEWQGYLFLDVADLHRPRAGSSGDAESNPPRPARWLADRNTWVWKESASADGIEFRALAFRPDGELVLRVLYAHSPERYAQYLRDVAAVPPEFRRSRGTHVEHDLREFPAGVRGKIGDDWRLHSFVYERYRCRAVDENTFRESFETEIRSQILSAG